ncbi:hypothetical protein MM1S1540310_3049 [Mycobacteroides abscessus subsp. bolletii 1S-154-0310]|nr:hypothetical protein MM1S1510930_3492 [Mycobacteroides abscessus subsp. bolletii 1S-151-0930]EIU68952.1 hypothetical protein MM1S1520914_3698 [Mycobacteroides abscessus subsp. bolletii 1S-152-0914]EIU73732.1 hypothetical protein MM1S1530915_3041 [Mycobacteroides abscessus subsp. bolletii 1S-153-0915]EIU80036.1 hypothetical protein MM1S1540310_3049 [Mycobacteroides abscessus subsp. bolletii 1S-154-0310]MBE5481659.1 hypothetical protein [Mycobacteroides abscessus]SKN72063.1 Uncharacterised pr
MGWVKIPCAERDQVKADHDLVPFASCTDLGAQFHSEPEMFIEWGDRGTDTSVLRDFRYPELPSEDPAVVRPDRKPCEHYRFEEDGCPD